MAKPALRPAPAPVKEQEPAPAAAAAKPQKPKKKGRGKLFWIGLVLMSVVGAGGTWMMVGNDAPDAPDAPAAKAEKPPIFVHLESFTVNLQHEVGEQYLQVTLTVKATDDAVAASMKLHMPEIRNRLLLLLSSKLPSELLTVPGKVQLGSEILGEVKKSLPEALQEHVAAVYFTSFVIQ